MRTEKLGEYIQKCRKAKKLTQEELCAGICDRTTLSRLERGKQTPGRDKLCALLHRLGLPGDLVPESEHDAKISALKKDIRADVIEFEKADQKTRPQLREQAMAKLKQMEKLTEKDDVINQQYILSTQVTLGKPDGPYTPAQRRKLLEKAIQMTVPDFARTRRKTSGTAWRKRRSSISLPGPSPWREKEKKQSTFTADCFKLLRKMDRSWKDTPDSSA